MRSKSGVVHLALVVVLMLATFAAASATAQPPSEGFVPVDQLPAQEHLPAARFVMTAYAIAWAAVFAYLWSIWRRLGRVERDIADVRRRVGDGARR